MSSTSQLPGSRNQDGGARGVALKGQTGAIWHKDTGYGCLCVYVHLSHDDISLSLPFLEGEPNIGQSVFRVPDFGLHLEQLLQS